MVTRKDVDKIKDAGNAAYRLARRDLEKLWATLPFAHPEACREILLQAVPGLVEKYGQMAAVAALEWYEQLRAAAPGLPAYRATLPPASGLQGEVVRASLGGLWETDKTRRQVERDKVFNALNAIVEKGVKQAARDTVTYNARRDPAKPRYARVPSGEKTCAFCMMLASRGFVYKNAETAGMTEDFHDKCDCQIVPEFGKGSARIPGYDPDAMQEKYQEARKQAQAELRKAGINRAPTPGETAQQMRKLYADSLSDGEGVKRSNYVRKASKDGTMQTEKMVEYCAYAKHLLAQRGLMESEHYKLPPSVPAEPPEDWPEDLPLLRAKEWNHILYGEKPRTLRGKTTFTGGHQYGYGWINGKPQFKESWTEKDIAYAIEAVLRTGILARGKQNVYEATVDNEVLRVTVATRKNKKTNAETIRITSAFPVTEV